MEPGQVSDQITQPTRASSQQAIQDHPDALVKPADLPAHFTDDVVATFDGTDQRATGREAARQLIRLRPQTRSTLGRARASSPV
jgi:hypothetical protein